MMLGTLPNTDDNYQQRWRDQSPRNARSPRKKKDEHPITIYLQPKKEELKSKKFPAKGVMLKILKDVALKDGNLKEFISQFDDMTLVSVCNDIDDLRNYSEDELRDLTKKEMVKGILNNVANFGLNHVLQFLTVVELTAVVTHMELEVDSQSKEILIDSIVEKKSYVKPKPKKKVKPSSEKPAIKEGITKVDLQTWFNREDLEEWLRNKGAKVSGKKKELIDRIIKYLSGDITTTTGKRGKKRKRGSKSREASAEEGVKEDESGEQTRKKKKVEDKSNEDKSEK